MQQDLWHKEKRIVQYTDTNQCFLEYVLIFLVETLNTSIIIYIYFDMLMQRNFSKFVHNFGICYVSGCADVAACIVCF